MNTVKVLTLENNHIPKKLKCIIKPPSILYYRGSSLEQILNRPIVAIVGSRKVDDYGRFITKKFASELARKGIVVISGLALGVDAIAHTAAISEKGTTIAVLPSGIKNIYPRTNDRLGREIERSGGLLSEYPDAQTPFASNFLDRNRIISGLADVVIVTQAAAKSGSLNTAAHAKKQGKIVMAVPGPITNPLCEGTNTLIKNGAIPLLDSSQVLKLLKISPENSAKLAHYTAIEQTIVDLISSGISDSDSIISQSGQSAELIMTALTMLEIKGDIIKSGTSWIIS